MTNNQADMKTTKCKACGSTDITVTITVNPNNIARITDYCHDDETITENGWCNECCEYVELEIVAESEPESDVSSILDWTPLFLKTTPHGDSQLKHMTNHTGEARDKLEDMVFRYKIDHTLLAEAVRKRILSADFVNKYQGINFN